MQTELAATTTEVRQLAAEREIGRAVVDLGPYVAAFPGEQGQPGRQVKRGQRMGRQRDGLGPPGDFAGQVVEQRELQCQRLVGGPGDTAF